MRLGSLFDGSGGFPLAGVVNGVEPVWASEIEPYPLRVTAKRFPAMKQLGDVTKINGAEIEPVDIITFGSPCQDLSVAGAQKGIHEGERSSLFFEAIRIIKEMREHDSATGRSDKLCRPRFAVWENVPGAFSSNKGKDFQAVLQALCDVCGETVPVPEPPKGKWAKAGCIVGDGYSIAWRVYDAQYWGVPQRRKRIYLVADFGSERAGEILFESEGMCGDSSESGEAREGTADHDEGSAGRGVHAFDITGITSNSMKSPTPDSCFRERFISRSLDTFVGSPECNQGGTVVVHALDQQGGKGGANYTENVTPTLCSDSHGTPHGVVYTEIARTLAARHDSSPCVDRGQNVVALDCRNMVGNVGISGTLQAKNEGGFSLNFINPVVYDQQRIGQYGDSGICSNIKARDCKSATDLVVERENHRYIVRRLTPLECCRLQGFPDWWEDGANGNDSARYKMWGNGIALPCAADVLRRIAKEARD